MSSASQGYRQIETDDCIQSSSYDASVPKEVYLPTVLFIIAPTDSMDTLYREQDISQRKMEAENFLNNAFMNIAHHEFRPCDDGDDMRNAVQRFSEQVTQDQQPFIVFLGHGAGVNSQSKLSFSKEKVDATELLETITNSFRTKSEVEGSKRPVRCIFTQCDSHLVAPSAFTDAPRILCYNELLISPTPSILTAGSGLLAKVTCQSKFITL